jgi:hypothetical protein
MQLRTLGLAVVATLTLSGSAWAQSVTIERHDSMRSDRVMRAERVERTDRLRVREPRVTGTVTGGKSMMAPGQRKKVLRVQTGREAMEEDDLKPSRRGSITIHRR